MIYLRWSRIHLNHVVPSIPRGIKKMLGDEADSILGHLADAQLDERGDPGILVKVRGLKRSPLNAAGIATPVEDTPGFSLEPVHRTPTLVAGHRELVNGLALAHPDLMADELDGLETFDVKSDVVHVVL